MATDVIRFQLRSRRAKPNQAARTSDRAMSTKLPNDIVANSIRTKRTASGQRSITKDAMTAMTQLKHLFSAVAVIILFSLATTTMAAPKPDLWERWSKNDSESTRSIDHQAWDRLLKRYLSNSADGISRFAYAKVGKSGQRQLQNYLKQMSQVEISRFNRDQQRAFWINVYNALTVDIVLSHFPVRSIRDISSGLFTPGPWDLKLIKIENEDLTLNDIEHRILRPIWKDPRIHYVVNCASLGCPNLQTQAFTAENSEDLMEKASAEFINHPRGARVINGKLQVSSIYNWFEVDFGGTEAGVINHLKRYAQGDLLAALKTTNRIDNDGYDWRINAQIKPKQQLPGKREYGS